jgi:hypothetical protein
MVGIADKSSLAGRDTIDNILHPKRNVSTQKDIVKSAKLSQDQADKLKEIQLMLGGTESDAIRWAIEAAWKEHGARISEIAEAKRKLGTITL